MDLLRIVRVPSSKGEGSEVAFFGNHQIAHIAHGPRGHKLRWLHMDWDAAEAVERFQTREAAYAALYKWIRSFEMNPEAAPLGFLPPNRSALDAQLDRIEASLPQMIRNYPNGADFRREFAVETARVLETSGEHFDHVLGRIDQMLAGHGAGRRDPHEMDG